MGVRAGGGLRQPNDGYLCLYGDDRHQPAGDNEKEIFGVF